MSYCVHCGVELADSENSCPLCGTPVVDPSRLTTDSIPTFPKEEDHRPINHRFAVVLISFFLIVPVLVTLTIDLLIEPGLSWSLYVLSGVLYLCTFIVFPVACPKLSSYIYIAVDGLSTALILLAIHAVSGASGWYLPIALPVTLWTFIITELFALVVRNKKMIVIRRGGLLFLLLALLSTAIDLTIKHTITWSIYAVIPLVALGLPLFAVSFSRRACDWMRRNLFL
ncbi:MAG: zinc ribbon domain-containing protein [Bacteroidales bacterium]|nr:zinc ribbon domain-containing protein [Bacteroidales bacterium]